MTGPEERGDVSDASIAPAPQRPRRPALVELAAALLIVSGLSSILTTFLAEMQGTGTGPTGVLILALNVLMIVTGILIRRGRAWRLGLNVAAIALFIELTLLPSAFGILFAAMDALVLFALIRHRAWFQWSADDAEADAATAPDASDRPGATDR